MNFLELFSIFDWITPVKGFIEDVTNDPTLFQSNSWTYFVDYKNSSISANEIEDILAVHGIHTWGSQITGGDYFFSVSLEQAGYAEYILMRYGVDLQGHSMDPPRPKKRGRR